ncbi:hypothetical protein GCM10028819_43210 [Spirosoma humi]
MILRIACFTILVLTARFAFPQSVESGVYLWAQTTVTKKPTAEQRVILDGSSIDFSHINIHATTLLPRQDPHPAHKHDDEELIIVKEGKLTITIAGESKTLGAGSVALFMPGDEHGFENKEDAPATYYVMRYTAKEPVDSERGQKAGGSFWIEWNDVVFQPHDKGGIRRMFDRATAMTKRFEMHVTTLNKDLWSHPPHTHRAAEILLMIDGSAQESIDGKRYPATVGDLIFLESNIPHAIQNTSRGSCTYFAFQFE